MKRVCNRGSHAAMLGGKLVQRLDRLGIAQDNGNLPALGAQGSLTLGACLGGGHGSEVHVAKRIRLGARDAQAVAGRVAIDLKDRRVGRDVGQAADLREVLTDAGQNVAEKTPDSREGGNLLREVAVAGEGLHLYLRVEPIPTMCPSYSVTSDTSTTVRREAA